MEAEPGGNFLMIVVITERPVESKLTGRRQPLEHEGLRVELVVQLRCADAKRAEVVGEHRHVLDLGLAFALQPEAGSVRSPEELVGDETIVDGEPVRELALRYSALTEAM